MNTRPAGQTSYLGSKAAEKAGLLLLLLTLLILAHGRSAHALDIAFRDTAAVTRAIVTLADVAEIGHHDGPPDPLETLKGQMVAKSPDAGEQITLDSRAIIQKLSRTSTIPETVRWSGADAIVVTRQGTTITPGDVQHIIDTFLRENEPAGTRYSFTPANPPAPFSVPSGDLRWEVIPSNPNIVGSSRFTLIGRLDSQVVRNFSVRGVLRAMIPVVVAVSNLQRDTVITEAQVRMESMDITGLKGPCLQREEVVGKKVLRAVKAGSAIESSTVEFPPMVKKGAMVKIIARTSDIELTATGIAKTDGKQGQVIKVTNIGSEKEIFCRVMAPGVVEVQI